MQHFAARPPGPAARPFARRVARHRRQLSRRLRRLARCHLRDERGDVPGWVMITVMTVAIVGAIWAVADEQLSAMLRTALESVGGKG